MAIKYVDYEGEAGTGDGSSFANRASKIEYRTFIKILFTNKLTKQWLSSWK